MAVQFCFHPKQMRFLFPEREYFLSFLPTRYINMLIFHSKEDISPLQYIQYTPTQVYFKQPFLVSTFLSYL